MSYEDLYALWERQNWKAHEIDFTVDKEQWLATPSISQLDTMWSFSSFYIGEERVAADLAPFVMAAPSGEIEIFLATQLVDEARHAAFFDRFMAEVMALEAEDIRGRLAAMEETHAARRGGRCSTISCAGSRSRSRRGRTTSTCSWRASSPTTS